MIQAAEELGKKTGISSACQALGVPRSSVYRARRPKPAAEPRPTPKRALSPTERATVRQVLNSEEFWDSSPRQVYARLLDEGSYLCHWRTMYRILDEHQEVQERRNQLTHPVYARPELLATGPNQLWSWDITKLKGPAKWTYYYLYVILDVFSRYAVGWTINTRQTADVAYDLIAITCDRQGIQPGQLVLHADRGGPMRSKPVAMLLADLGVTKTHSRPYVSNDNPYSEAQFKTMKYRPDYPKRFGSQEDARFWAGSFFDWYNHEHRHSALGLMPPAIVHFGQAQFLYDQRQQVLQAAYDAHPERFVRGLPTPPELPSAVWINRPQVIDEADQLTGLDHPLQQQSTYRLDTKFQHELSHNA